LRFGRAGRPPLIAQIVTQQINNLPILPADLSRLAYRPLVQLDYPSNRRTLQLT
jgi:hypothetical protein